MPTTRPHAATLPLPPLATPHRARPASPARPATPPTPADAAVPATAPSQPAPAATPSVAPCPSTHATTAGADAPPAVPAVPPAPAPRAAPAPPAPPAPATAPASRPTPLPTARPHDIPRLTTSAWDLLDLARHGLAEASLAGTPHDRYAAAHLSALRAAAAVIAARARPSESPNGQARRARPLSAWVLLATVAPELGEWAAFFASGARKRAAAEAHLPGAVTARDADDLLRDAETFLAVVETKLGGAARPSLLDRGVG